MTIFEYEYEWLLYSGCAVLGLLYGPGCCTVVLGLLATRALLYLGTRTRAVLVLVLGIPTRVPTAVGELTVGELIFSHSYNFFFGREFALGATIGAMAKFAHVTNRHKISYKLNV
eukprot:SAG25_NODE_2161_length_1883_cov_746.187780_2_plen_115_part_00